MRSRSVHTTCGYRNASDRMVILRCIGPEQFFLERVVFPFELLSFECPPNSEVEIWSHSLGGPEMVETFPSRELAIEPAAASGMEPATALPTSAPIEAVGGLELAEHPSPWAAAS